MKLFKKFKFKWDSIQCEFKNVFIKYLTKIFLLSKIYVQFLNNCKKKIPRYDYLQFSFKFILMLFKL